MREPLRLSSNIRNHLTSQDPPACLPASQPAAPAPYLNLIRSLLHGQAQMASPFVCKLLIRLRSVAPLFPPQPPKPPSEWPLSPADAPAVAIRKAR